MFKILISFFHISKVKTTAFPDCAKYNESCTTAKNEGYNLVYSKAATSTNDNILYAFSTIGVPTIAIAHTIGGDLDMEFDWDKLLNSSSLMDAIIFSGKGKVVYKYGVAFTKVILIVISLHRIIYV